MRHALVMFTFLAAVLACGGEPEIEYRQEDIPARFRTTNGLVGDGVLELREDGDACVWTVHVLDGDRSTVEIEAGAHPAPCPSIHTVTDFPAFPDTAVVDGRIVRTAPGKAPTWQDAPPDGALTRVGYDGDTMVAATLLEFEGPGPHVYDGTTYRWEPTDGVLALAIRWRLDRDTWTRDEVATTTTGWDLALGTDALKNPVPALEQPGETLTTLGDLVDDPALLAALEAAATATSQREGWLVATTPHGRVASGYVEGEGIRSTGPVLMERDGAWTAIPRAGEGSSSLEVRISDDLLLARVPGGAGVVVDLTTGKVSLESEGALALVRASNRRTKPR